MKTDSPLTMALPAMMTRAAAAMVFRPLLLHGDTFDGIPHAKRGRKQVQQLRKLRHVHGRGAGAGRGLTDAGEPWYEDLHSSWQAARRERARQTKAVRRSLRESAVLTRADA